MLGALFGSPVPAAGSGTSNASAGGGDGAPEPSPSSSEMVATEVTGSHVLAIGGYSVAKGLGYGDSIRSAAFAAAGHRWSVVYYPNGFNECFEGCISMLLRLERSPGLDNDGEDVNARFTISLLDENGVPWCSRCSHGDGSRGRRFASMRRPRGFERFIGRGTLEKSGYIRDDRLVVRCDITVLKVTNAAAATDAARFVAVPPPDMGRDLGRLLSGGEGADVTFEVAGETVAAHRSVLATRSPVFRAEFFGPLRKKTPTAETCAQIVVDDMEARVFRDLLHFIYTDSAPEVGDGDEAVAMMQHLLVAADRFGVERLKLICEDKLCDYIDTSSVGTVLALAEQHHCHGLKKACFQFLRAGNNLNAAVGTDGFHHLTNSCPSVLKELLLASEG